MQKKRVNTIVQLQKENEANNYNGFIARIFQNETLKFYVSIFIFHS